MNQALYLGLLVGLCGSVCAMAVCCHIRRLQRQGGRYCSALQRKQFAQSCLPVLWPSCGKQRPRAGPAEFHSQLLQRLLRKDHGPRLRRRFHAFRRRGPASDIHVLCCAEGSFSILWRYVTDTRCMHREGGLATAMGAAAAVLASRELTRDKVVLSKKSSDIVPRHP